MVRYRFFIRYKPVTSTWFSHSQPIPNGTINNCVSTVKYWYLYTNGAYVSVRSDVQHEPTSKKQLIHKLRLAFLGLYRLVLAYRPIFLSVGNPRRFLETDPDVLHTWSVRPCPPVIHCVFSFFRQRFGPF